MVGPDFTKPIYEGVMGDPRAPAADIWFIPAAPGKTGGFQSSKLGSGPPVTAPVVTKPPTMDPGRLPGLGNDASGGQTDITGTGLSNDALTRLAQVYLAGFTGGTKAPESQIAVPVTQGGGSSSSITTLVILALVVGGGWYWYKHRKGAGGASHE